MSCFSNCRVAHLPKSTLLFLCSWELLRRDASLLHLSICCSGPLQFAHTQATCLLQLPVTLSVLFQQSSSRMCTQPWVLLSPILPVMLRARAPPLTGQHPTVRAAWRQREQQQKTRTTWPLHWLLGTDVSWWIYFRASWNVFCVCAEAEHNSTGSRLRGSALLLPCVQPYSFAI